MLAIREKSSIMRLCEYLGLEQMAWSLRRIYCPVDKQALVLEVGSGGNPYCRSNVLLDAYEETRERHWVPLVADRPTVLGFVENLPFKDKVFDFVIASHVLEHSADPIRFISELQRVARAGYIEVPDAFMERINPYHDHRLEITIRNRQLVIRKKGRWKVDPDLYELYTQGANAIIAGESIPRHPFAFHVRFFWHGSIDYVVTNPEEDAGWESPPMAVRKPQSVGLRQTVNNFVLACLRKVLSQRRRNRCLNLQSLLACPTCRSDEVSAHGDVIVCGKCRTTYSVRDGIPVMYPTESLGR